MELSHQEYIKMKQRKYYLDKYVKKDACKNFIKKRNNDKNEDNFKRIYYAACSRIKDTMIKNEFKIEFSYKEIFGCDRTEFKEYILNNLEEGMNLDNFGEWEMD